VGNLAKPVGERPPKKNPKFNPFRTTCDQATSPYSQEVMNILHILFIYKELEIQAAAMQRQLAAVVSDPLLLFRA
jgi:hypothetical protein